VRTQGLYTQHLGKGVIHGVQVRNTIGIDLSIEPETYIQRGTKPPIQELPTEDFCNHRCTVNSQPGKVIDLVAPNGKAIVGAVAEDDTIRSFTYSYDSNTTVRMYVLDDGNALPPGPVTLVDSEGNRWDSSKVEWHTLFKQP
jgi:hypothetical protein